MSNPHYKIMPDEVEPGKFRVVHYGSEYTVSYKRKLQHGLSRYKARKMLNLLEGKRLNAIDRLAEAITEWIENDPQTPGAQAALISSLSARHRLTKKTISTAVLMLAGGINA